MADPPDTGAADRTVDRPVELVASFFTLSGAGFGEPSRYGFAQRCAAAAAAGFAGVGLHVDDLARTIADGLDVPGMQAVLSDTGLRIVEIEFLAGWAFDVDGTALADTERKVYQVADAFGGRHISAGEFRALDGGRPLDLESAAERLGELSGRAAERGLLIAVEAFPWSAIPDVGTAVELLRRSGAPNAGLMIDVWHFFNGGADVDLLEGLPEGGIAAVQLNDGPLVHDDFLRNARATRRLPGEGDLDVLGLVRAIERSGFTGPYGVEVNTPEFRALPISVAAEQAFTTAADVVRRARADQ